jgi:nitronate monooxygenase
MVLKTKLTELCGIEHPVIQGGMHYVGYAEMAAAVSNAGGLGIITALTVAQPPRGAEALRDEIRKCKSLTNKPFGVNITLLPVGVPPDYEGIMNVIIDEGVKIVETAGRNPEPVIKKLKSAGIIVIHKCVAIRHAETAARMGADMISMDGFDCGGHPGEEDVGNWVLLARAGRVLKIPFVASGGNVTGSQLAAAMAMGAEGVNMGTAFMATQEAPVHDGIKQALVQATERDTTHVFRTLNNTERVFKNKTAMEVREIEANHPGDFSKIAHLVAGANYRVSFQETGDASTSVWSCGQSIGLIDGVPSCKDFIEGVVAEAEDIIKNRLQSKL